MIYTIGHSTRTLDEFLAMLRQAGVDLLVDVRSAPSSRRVPHFNKGAIPFPYLYIKALGGHRPKSTDHSSNTLWQNQSFRNYADYAQTPAFRDGLRELEALPGTPAIMCAEAVWWRCHRRIIADYLLADGFEVGHIMGLGKITPAKLTRGAAIGPGKTVIYPPEESQPRLL